MIWRWEQTHKLFICSPWTIYLDAVGIWTPKKWRNNSFKQKPRRRVLEFLVASLYWVPVLQKVFGCYKERSKVLLGWLNNDEISTQGKASWYESLSLMHHFVPYQSTDTGHLPVLFPCIYISLIFWSLSKKGAHSSVLACSTRPKQPCQRELLDTTLPSHLWDKDEHGKGDARLRAVLYASAKPGRRKGRGLETGWCFPARGSLTWVSRRSTILN